MEASAPVLAQGFEATKEATATAFDKAAPVVSKGLEATKEATATAAMATSAAVGRGFETAVERARAGGHQGFADSLTAAGDAVGTVNVVGGVTAAAGEAMGKVEASAPVLAQGFEDKEATATALTKLRLW